MATENARRPYEEPAVVEYGEIDEVTQGPLALNPGDSLLGAQPLPPVNGGGS